MAGRWFEELAVGQVSPFATVHIDMELHAAA